MDPTQTTNNSPPPASPPAPAAGERSEPAAGAGGEAGDKPSPHAKPKRRYFKAAYKLSILEKLDQATEPGAVALILRQEGLYSSHITDWRRWRDRVNRGEPAVVKRPAGVSRAEFEKLQRENAGLQKKLDQARMLIELQKKLSLAMENISDGDAP